MAKTRAQTRDLGIKKEEEVDRKPALLLHSGNNTITHNKVAKRKPSKNKNNPRTKPVKVEEDTDTKSLLQAASTSSKLQKRKLISQEHINRLIDTIVNDKKSVCKAASIVKISIPTARYYYNVYKNDPKKRIPSPRNKSRSCFTQEQIEDLIRYINGDKMTVRAASEKANMPYKSGRYYYNKYLQDPDHKFPIRPFHRNYTQDKKNELIGYIVNDKMSILQASKKAKLTHTTGVRHYHKYFDDQNPDIPTPSHINRITHLTQEQINEVIRYIVSDK